MKSRRRSLVSSSCVSLSLLCASSAFAAPPSVASSASAQTTSAAPFLRLPKTATPTRYGLDLTLRPADENFSGQIEIGLQIAESKDVIWLHASRELQIGDTSLRTAQGEQTPKVELVGKDLLALIKRHRHFRFVHRQTGLRVERRQQRRHRPLDIGMSAFESGARRGQIAVLALADF